MTLSDVMNSYCQPSNIARYRGSDISADMTRCQKHENYMKSRR